MKAAVSDFVQTERLAQQMDEHGLDAIVARAGINFTYLSGLVYPGTLARHVDLADSPRGVYLVWPRTGEPRMVVNPIADRDGIHSSRISTSMRAIPNHRPSGSPRSSPPWDWPNRKSASRPTSSAPPIGTSCAAVCLECGRRIPFI